MKYFLPLFFLLVTGTGCKQKLLSGKDLEYKLKATMTEYLQSTLPPGTLFSIKEMSYYPEVKKKEYICNFRVDMRRNNRDTTGTVVAHISNDFKKVDRTQ